MAFGPRTASQADAAVSLRSAVARLHHHLCRGLPAAAHLAGSPPAGAAIEPALPAVIRRAVDPVGGARRAGRGLSSLLSAPTRAIHLGGHLPQTVMHRYRAVAVGRAGRVSPREALIVAVVDRAGKPPT